MQSSQSSVTRTSTVRSSGGGVDEDLNTYRPKSAIKSVIVQRGGGGYGRTSRSSMYSGMGGGFGASTRISASFSPAVYSQMAGTGIADFRGTREKEKREMQDCNERLATYIEKVRWLEARTKQLEAENEALRKRKQEDWRPIKDMYEGELQQAREVIKELSTQKGVGEAKLAGLQDEIESLRELIGTYEANSKDYAKKIDQLNSQIGEYEGELTALRLRCGSLEDEAAKLRALVSKYKEENGRLRADLDAETAAHIEQEVMAQTRQEECEFLQELLAKLQLSEQEPVTVKGVDMETFFRGEIRQAIQAIQQTYDEKLDQITVDCESKVASQMNQLRSGNVRDTMEAENAKMEVKRFRDQLAEKNSRIAILESELAGLRSEKMGLVGDINALQLELDTLRSEYAHKSSELQCQVEALMAQINELIDAKMSLELEIACYKKLLEGEENRTGLRQLVEQTIGMRGEGASQIADMIGGSQSSSTTARMDIQKSRTGLMGIRQVDPSGGCIELELDQGARTPQELKGMKLVKRVNGNDVLNIDLATCELGRLEGGKTLKLFASGAKSTAANKFEHVVTGQFSFGAGAADYVLIDNGREVSQLRVRQSR